eukprot:scaffold535_cov160-Prasinococcus_capsulatus_cf.AAC.1
MEDSAVRSLSASKRGTPCFRVKLSERAPAAQLARGREMVYKMLGSDGTAKGPSVAIADGERACPDGLPGGGEWAHVSCARHTLAGQAEKAPP